MTKLYTKNGYNYFDSVYMCSYICPVCGHVHFPEDEGVYQCENCNHLFVAHMYYHEVMTCTDNYHDEYEMYIEACESVANGVYIHHSKGYSVPLANGGVATSYLSATQDVVDVEKFVKQLPASLKEEFVAFSQYRRLPEFREESRRAMRLVLERKPFENITKSVKKFGKDFYNWFYYRFGGGIICIASLVLLFLTEGTFMMWISGLACIASLLALIIPVSMMYINSIK